MSNVPEHQGPRTVAQVRNQQPRAFGHHPEPPAEDGMAPPAVTSDEIEKLILKAENELATLTETHVGIADAAGKAEARWKNHRDRVIVKIIREGEKGAKDTREAFAKQRACGAINCPCAGDPWSGERLYYEYEVTIARKDASAKAMRAIEARLNAFQTIAANLRAVT